MIRPHRQLPLPQPGKSVPCDRPSTTQMRPESRKARKRGEVIDRAAVAGQEGIPEIRLHLTQKPLSADCATTLCQQFCLPWQSFIPSKDFPGLFPSLTVPIPADKTDRGVGPALTSLRPQSQRNRSSSTIYASAGTTPSATAVLFPCLKPGPPASPKQVYCRRISVLCQSDDTIFCGPLNIR